MKCGQHRCPACGRFAPTAAFVKGARGEHALESGQPGGRGKPWKTKPMPRELRTLLAELFRRAAKRLDT